MCHEAETSVPIDAVTSGDLPLFGNAVVQRSIGPTTMNCKFLGHDCQANTTHAVSFVPRKLQTLR